MPSPPLLKSRGLSLAEVLVGLFLAGLLLTLLLQLLVTSFKVGTEEMGRSAAEAGLTVTYKKLSADLLSSTPAGLTLSTGGDRLLIHPLLTVTNRRQMVYEDRLLYWSFDSAAQELLRSEYLSAPVGAFDTQPLRLTQAEIGALPLTGGTRVTYRLANVSAFKVSNPASVPIPDVGSPLSLVLETTVELAQTRRAFRLERKLWLPGGAF